LSILLLLFGVNGVLIMFGIQCNATECAASFCIVECLYNILDFVINIFSDRYVHTGLTIQRFLNEKR